MERYDYGLSLVAGVGAFLVVLASFYNLLQSSIQIIGLGTAFSIGLAAFRFRSDRNENRRRIRNERILRSMPTVYNPLWKWATTTKREMRKLIPDELYSPLQGPPDLSVEGDFAAIVGDTLKGTAEKTVATYELYSQLSSKLRTEYSNKLQSELTQHGISTPLEQVSLRVGQVNWPIQMAPWYYTLKGMREIIAPVKEVFLICPNQIPCPEDIVKTVQTPQELPSFEDFQNAKMRLMGLLDSLISLLSEALAKGEPDWKLLS